LRASAERGNLNSVGGLGAIEANLSHALTIKHAVTPKFWHGFHPKQT